ncbi:uncharacterized protein LOC111286759 isoform X2 [Durio zibethinus]|uniref:Uncharacterized protein LOC111286759 isoform X2 n=1 Tax=Durio zibethinus TaxID=66656 RepID=A0A6P5XY13_DURZI|nr:uncharacterized protein LOC111286759 isoform X2 [Durio zibethinus]
MATPPSITDLFAQLASHLQLPIRERENEEEVLTLSISKLNQSLNLNENPNSRVRVLDTALSLMCFKAPQVFDSMIEYLATTIISVLSSSVNCKVFPVQNEQFLLMGSASLGLNFVELIEMFNNVYAKLEGKGVFSHLLLRAVVRVAVLASCYQYSFPNIPILDVKLIEGNSAAVSKLHCHLPTELSLENEEIPLRLLFWYLDPLTLKQAVSKILKDTTERPFLCLSDEFHQRTDWRAIIICLALSPVMFIETRALLHNWFLKTEQLHPAVKPTAVVVASIDHKSLWALAIDFPDWFYFASVLLFTEKNLHKNFQSKCILATPKVEETHDKELLSTYAARYIAWILSPISNSNQGLLVDFLTKISESWVVKHNKEAATFKKKLKKPKVNDKREDYAVAKEYDCQQIGIWLNEIENIYIQYANTTINSSPSADSNASNVLSLQQNVLIRKIPLGILIGCPNCITEDGCELLLHYAATGIILRPRETMSAGLRHVKKNSERQDLTTWMEKCSKRDVLAGACIVFSLTDAVDNISTSFFETEESGLDFIYQVKVKARKYLTNCIKRLSMLSIDKDGVLMLRDLCNRLERWRHQGQVSLQIQKDIGDVINDLSQKLSSNEKTF